MEKRPIEARRTSRRSREERRTKTEELKDIT
jgi:hypothetical protein